MRTCEVHNTVARTSAMASTRRARAVLCVLMLTGVSIGEGSHSYHLHSDHRQTNGLLHNNHGEFVDFTSPCQCKLADGLSSRSTLPNTHHHNRHAKVYYVVRKGNIQEDDCPCNDHDVSTIQSTVSSDFSRLGESLREPILKAKPPRFTSYSFADIFFLPSRLNYDSQNSENNKYFVSLPEKNFAFNINKDSSADTFHTEQLLNSAENTILDYNKPDITESPLPESDYLSNTGDIYATMESPVNNLRYPSTNFAFKENSDNLEECSEQSSFSELHHATRFEDNNKYFNDATEDVFPTLKKSLLFNPILQFASGSSSQVKLSRPHRSKFTVYAEENYENLDPTRKSNSHANTIDRDLSSPDKLFTRALHLPNFREYPKNKKIYEYDVDSISADSGPFRSSESFSDPSKQLLSNTLLPNPEKPLVTKTVFASLQAPEDKQTYQIEGSLSSRNDHYHGNINSHSNKFKLSDHYLNPVRYREDSSFTRYENSVLENAKRLSVPSPSGPSNIHRTISNSNSNLQHHNSNVPAGGNQLIRNSRAELANNNEPKNSPSTLTETSNKTDDTKHHETQYRYVILSKQPILFKSDTSSQKNSTKSSGKRRESPQKKPDSPWSFSLFLTEFNISPTIAYANSSKSDLPDPSSSSVLLTKLLKSLNTSSNATSSSAMQTHTYTWSSPGKENITVEPANKTSLRPLSRISTSKSSLETSSESKEEANLPSTFIGPLNKSTRKPKSKSTTINISDKADSSKKTSVQKSKTDEQMATNEDPQSASVGEDTSDASSITLNTSNGPEPKKTTRKLKTKNRKTKNEENSESMEEDTFSATPTKSIHRADKQDSSPNTSKTRKSKTKEQIATDEDSNQNSIGFDISDVSSRPSQDISDEQNTKRKSTGKPKQTKPTAPLVFSRSSTEYDISHDVPTPTTAAPRNLDTSESNIEKIALRENNDSTVSNPKSDSLPIPVPSSLEKESVSKSGNIIKGPNSILYDWLSSRIFSPLSVLREA